MSEKDETARKLEGIIRLTYGGFGCSRLAGAILDAIDARIREAMKPSEVARLEHRPECASWNMSHAGGMQMAATPCNCDLYKRMVAPVQPEATAAKTSEAPCSCREIQTADPSRHFKGCARRVEKADAPYRGEIRSMGLAREWLQHHWPMDPPNALVCSLAEVIAAERAWRSAKELEAKAACDPPAAKPPEPSKPAAVGPERVTLYIDENGDWWKFQTSDPMTPEMPAVTYVRASAHNRAVELLRSAVERWPSYNVRDDVVAFLAEHDAAADP